MAEGIVSLEPVPPGVVPRIEGLVIGRLCAAGALGWAVGMKVIAEGVETETQRKFLRVAGVHAM